MCTLVTLHAPSLTTQAVPVAIRKAVWATCCGVLLAEVLSCVAGTLVFGAALIL